MLKRTVLLTVIGLLAACPSALAASIALEFTGLTSQIPSYSELSSTRGWEFSTSAAINVTALGGAFDSLSTKELYPNDPFPPFMPYHIADSLPVGIWNSSGTLLVSGTVLRTDPRTGHFSYHSISPILLPVGDYTIGAYLPPGVGYASRVSGLVTDPLIMYKGPRVINSPALSYPTIPEGGNLNGNFGPTFQFTASIPEPATWSLVLLSVAACCIFRRLRSKLASSLATEHAPRVAPR